MSDYLCKEQNDTVYFKEDPGVTDAIFVVEDKEIHVTKSILMQASPVFRAMFTSDKKEIRIRFPEQKYENFVLFLRCFYPGEHVKLNDSILEQVLPLAKEYRVDSLMKIGHKWLQREARSRMADVSFVMKCFYFAVEFDLKELYEEMFDHLEFVEFSEYTNSTFYGKLPSKYKAMLLEKHCFWIEIEGFVIKRENEGLSKTFLEIKNQCERQGKAVSRLQLMISRNRCSKCVVLK
ncbi:uncharacterized protein LOC134237713 [Saccostrea cucullata]|uniref:uncharacterized protein LOC134237713 n=1 Tax=Saccostrea cuccullata TaxID=36930 RepID=UPI002ED09E19